MPSESENEMLRNSIELLVEKSTECFDLSQADARLADLQRANARKLAGLGDALIKQAVDLNGQIEMTSGRTSAPMQEVPGALRARATRR